MNEIIEYTPVAPTWQSGLVKVAQNLRTDDVVKICGILGLVAVISVCCVCLSGSELSIANGWLEIKQPAPEIAPGQA